VPDQKPRNKEYTSLRAPSIYHILL